MKTSFKSRLFLLSYGIILSFIVGLIILNNTFLSSYYIHNRENSLIDAFEEIKDVDINDNSLSTSVYHVERKHNINVLILKQITDINPAYYGQIFSGMSNVYDAVYGNPGAIDNWIISQTIIEFNKELVLGESPSLGKQVNVFDDNYSAYIVQTPEDTSGSTTSPALLVLSVATTNTDGNFVFYIMTITIQSIQDSIQIFNSFTILVGFVFMILSGILMYFVSYRLTNPILEMNTVAEEISNLNFSKKVHVSSDDEIGTLGISINKMSSQLESFINELQLTNDKLGKEILYKTNVDKMRREFIANASHELKTPLSLIMGYAEALKFPDLDMETKSEYLNIILDESSKMNKLVMDLLKLSQLENRSIEFEFKEVALHDFINDTLKLFTIVFKEKGVKLTTDLVDAKVKTDYEQLQTVLTNFINNAINHVDDNKNISIESVLLENGKIRISVYNSGVKISDDEIENIWESFYKVDKARTRAYGGQGLGLSICKNILDSLGYDYGVKNVKGGVIFYFDIDN